MMKGLKLLSTALCAVPMLSDAAHSKQLKLRCLYENCSPAVLVPTEVKPQQIRQLQLHKNGQLQPNQNEQTYSACRSIDAHIRAIEFLLIKGYNDPTSAPDAALKIYQRYPEMVMALRQKEYIGLTNFADLPVGGYPKGQSSVTRLTPNEHVALVEDGYQLICNGLEID